MALLDSTVFVRFSGRMLSRGFFEFFVLEIVLLIVVIPGAYFFHAFFGTLGAIVFLAVLAVTYAFVIWGQKRDVEELRTYRCSKCKKYTTAKVVISDGAE